MIRGNVYPSYARLFTPVAVLVRAVELKQDGEEHEEGVERDAAAHEVRSEYIVNHADCERAPNRKSHCGAVCAFKNQKYNRREKDDKRADSGDKRADAGNRSPQNRLTDAKERKSRRGEEALY